MWEYGVLLPMVSTGFFVNMLAKYSVLVMMDNPSKPHAFLMPFCPDLSNLIKRRHKMILTTTAIIDDLGRVTLPSKIRQSKKWEYGDSIGFYDFGDHFWLAL